MSLEPKNNVPKKDWKNAAITIMVAIIVFLQVIIEVLKNQ